jgi:aminoglycoside 3-N-acetyltransferase
VSTGDLDRAGLVDGFRALGLEPGDTVLVHSAYKSLGGVKGGPQEVVETLLELLGPTGTLIMPTFNFAFCEGEPFDARTTPSRMGVLTEIVRTDPRARRVEHPIYSFAVIGRRADEAAALDEPSAYGRDSVFGRLRDWDAKIMVIGLAYNDSMTFFHHVEEMEGCDYRYVKPFSGKVTNTSGQTTERTVSMFVRDLDRGVITAVDPMGELLEDQGIVQVGTVGSARVSLMRAREVYEATARELAKGSGLLHRIEP